MQAVKPHLNHTHTCTFLQTSVKNFLETKSIEVAKKSWKNRLLSAIACCRWLAITHPFNKNVEFNLSFER